MVFSSNFPNQFFPVKYALRSHGALIDGRAGVRHLEKYVEETEVLWSDWKVVWLGACALLRTSVYLMKIDASSCINEDLRQGVDAEFKSIKDNKDEHPIFWEFLFKERNNLLKQYEWSAYEMWLEEDGTIRAPARMSLLTLEPKTAKSILLMKTGHYEGRNSLKLLQEGADWVEERIFAAIRRAGYDPDESRNLRTFEKPPPPKPTILGGGEEST